MTKKYNQKQLKIHYYLNYDFINLNNWFPKKNGIVLLEYLIRILLTLNMLKNLICHLRGL